MEITRETKLKDLLVAYPWLKTEITKVSEKFKMLNTPIGKIMVNKVTIEEMSNRSGVNTDVLIQRIEALIREH